MGHKVGDSVRVKPGSTVGDMLGEAADLTGIVGDVWTDERGDRVSVVYEPVQVYAYGMAAEEFVPDARLDEAPF